MLNNHPEKNFITIKKIHPHHLTSIAKRLAFIQKTCPHHVPRIIEFGFYSINNEQVLRMKTEKIFGLRLNKIANKNDALFKSFLRNAAIELLSTWRINNFVHGDLSPSNLILENTTQKLWAIDWILLLKSYQGTPAFASPEVFRGIHNHQSDLFAMHKIFNMEKKTF